MRVDGLHFADQLVRELQRKAFGLAFGEIDQDAGDIIRLGLEIDAGDDIGPILLLGKAGRFGIGRRLGQC